MAVSEEYQDLLKAKHEDAKFGRRVEVPKPLEDLLNTGRVRSMLDFGAGKGGMSETIKNRWPDIVVWTWDPAYNTPSEMPDYVDLITSTDVLEHVEPELLEHTLRDLAGRCSLQYHLIACHRATNILADGRNAHLIIKTPDWWQDKIDRLEWVVEYEQVHSYIKARRKGRLAITKYEIIISESDRMPPLLNDSIRGRRVAIVGNATSILDSQFGAEIDQHDVVVRMNRGIMPIAPQSIGERTDICFYSHWKFVEPAWPVTLECTRVHSSLKHRDTNNQDCFIPKSLILELSGILNGPKPTTGFCVLETVARCEPAEVNMYGFDFKKTGTWYQGNITRGNEKRHDFELEQELITKRYINDLGWKIRR